MKKPPRDARSVKKLRAIQRTFGAAIMRRLDDNQQMQRVWIDGRPALHLAASFIKPNDRLDSFERLEIYNRQYWFRIINSFYEDFPALRALLGEDRFYQLTLAYLEKNPSRSFTLRDLGDRLESFLRKEPRWVASQEKLARDIVRLEWAHIVAFDSAALPPIEIDDLLDSDPANLRVSLQPHLTLLACDYEVDDFVLAIRKRELPQAETSNAVSEKVKKRAAQKIKKPTAKKIWLAIHRSNNSVYYKRLDRKAYLILTALRKGAPLQAACEKALARQAVDETFPATLQAWFTQWASFGWLCRTS